MKDVKLIINGTVYKTVAVPNGEYTNCNKCAIQENACKDFEECLCALAAEIPFEMTRIVFVKEQ